MNQPDIAIRQAELIVKLYELRREPVMRAARSYVGGAFLPRSSEEFLSIMSAGGSQTSYVLQVFGYWDMVAAMVFNGALDEKLVFDSCHEMYFQFAKIRHFIEDFRQKTSLPEIFQNVQRLTEGSETGRARLDNMERYLKLSSPADPASETA